MTSHPQAHRSAPRQKAALAELLQRSVWLQPHLASQGAVGYLVGGCGRDALLGRPSADVDLAVAGDAVAVARRAADAVGGSFVLLDEARGTGRVVLSGGQVDTVDFTSLAGRPASDIEADLARRDYTINALAVPLVGPPDEILDPCGGLVDLEAGVVRAVSAAGLQEDPVRLLRGPRLAAQLDFVVAAETQLLLQEHAPLLAQASGERLRDELWGILQTPRAARTLALMGRWRLLDVLLPELAACRGVGQPFEHFWDVYHHSLQAVAAVEEILGERRQAYGWAVSAFERAVDERPWWVGLTQRWREKMAGGRSRAALLKFAALTHDVAKPQTRALERGRARFFGHTSEGAAMVGAMAGRLRLSAQEARLLANMVEYHLRPAQLASRGAIPTRRALYRYFRDLGDAALDTLFLSLADHLATRGPRLAQSEWRERVAEVAYVLGQHFEAEEVVVSPPKLVSGHDLMAALELEPGPLVGRLLVVIEEAQAAGEVATKDAALALAERVLSGMENTEER